MLCAAPNGGTNTSTMASITAGINHVNADWAKRHNDAVFKATFGQGKAFEYQLVKMLTSWADYARDHNERYSSLIGEDYILGEAWKQIGTNLRTLLNGELGVLDGGTLDGFIVGTMRENGIDTEAL